VLRHEVVQQSEPAQNGVCAVSIHIPAFRWSQIASLSLWLSFLFFSLPLGFRIKIFAKFIREQFFGLQVCVYIDCAHWLGYFIFVVMKFSPFDDYFLGDNCFFFFSCFSEDL
jgi:hypothetical protein